MKKQILQEKANILSAELLIYNLDFNYKKYIDWAIMLLEQGYDSDSICILAGLDDDDHEVQYKYFERSIEELNIEIIRDDNELIEYYAIYYKRYNFKYYKY